MAGQDLTTPTQYPNATRIENGTAYDVSGKPLGPVNDGEPQDPFSALGATDAPAPKKDPFAELGATSAPAPGNTNENLKPGETPGASQATGMGARKPGLFERIGNTILPGFGPNTAATQLIAPEQAMSSLERENHPILTGVGEFAGSLTSPENISIMAATSGLGVLAGPEAKLAAKVIPRLVSGGFSIQQIVGAAQQTPALWDAIKRGDESEAERLATHIILGTAGAVLAGQHAAGFEAKPSTAVGKLADKAIDRATQKTVDAFRSDASSLTAASKRVESAKTVHDVRVREADVATEQVKQAEQKLDIAKQNLEDQSGTQKEVDDAQSNLSAAAANANKARTALEDAHDTHATARADVDRINRNIEKSNSKIDAKRTKEINGTYEDLYKVAPSTPKGPAHYDEKDAQIARGYIEHNHENVQPIRNKQELFDALDHSQRSIENEIKPYVEKYGYEDNPSNVLMDVQDGLADSPQANFIERGINHLIELYPQLQEPLNLRQSEQIRADLNVLNRNDLNNKWGRNLSDALDGDPEFAARYYAAESLRNGTYDVFEDKGVQGIREKRRDETSIIRVRNAVERGIAKGGAVIRGSGQSGALRKMAAKGAPYVGAGIGAGVGGAAGGTIGAEIGGAAGAWAGKKLGAKINPGDLTQDAIVERMMRVKGAGVPTTEITGPGQPSNAGPRPIGLSAKDMQAMMRESGPLHADLATHYGESVTDVNYADLEKRFMDDMNDKKLHGVTLEGPEKKLLGQINQQNAVDALKARQTAQEQEAAGKTIGNVNLPQKIEPVLRAPESKLPNGLNTQEAIGHDLAHVIVGSELGLSFPDGIRSHLHPENAGSGRLMTAPIDWSDFVDDEGNIDPNKLSKNIADFATTYMAGGVYNDLYHDVPFTENHGLGADIGELRKFMRAAGFSPLEASKMIAQAADDAATMLSRPGMREIIEGHSRFREGGLNDKYHISPDRMEQILQDVKEGTKRETTNRKSSGNSGERNQAANEPGAGRKGKDEVGDDKAVSEKSKGNGEGKEGSPSKQSESPTASTSGPGSGAPKPNNPAISSVEQGGHAGGGVASEEELARPGHFVKIGRSGNATYQAKTPDFNIGPGEAGYRVENGKSPQLWAGQETPTTKAGIGRYTKEVFGDKPANPPQNPAFSAHKAGIPPERSTGHPEYDEIIKAGGAIPGGIQKGDPELDLPDLALFHDPMSGSTLALPTQKLAKEAVARELQKSRAMYAEADARKAAQTAAAQGDVSTAADEFNRRQGREKINTQTHPHDVEFAKRTADAFDTMQHNPGEPKTKASYDALKKDVDKQWDFATKDMGIKFEPWTKQGQPYANSKEMVEDVKNNKHLYFFRGGDMAEGNPLADADPKTGLTYNDKFRAVHDLFGHAAQGNQFGPKGEETAYQLHRQMFSPEAVPALTSETRGQNSWVNFGKHLRNAEGNIPAKGEQGFVSPTERPYAQQKTGLLPEQFQAAEPTVHKPFEGVHFSPVERQTLLGSERGKSLAGEERARLQHDNAVPGVYAYRRGTTPEPQIGSRSYQYELGGNKAIADIGEGGAQQKLMQDSITQAQAKYKAAGDNDTIALQKALNDGEAALRDAGYDGYENKGSVFLFGDQKPTGALVNHTGVAARVPIQPSNPAFAAKQNPAAAFIDPTGKFHELGDNATHPAFANELNKSVSDLLKEGWIRKAGQASYEGNLTPTNINAIEKDLKTDWKDIKRGGEYGVPLDSIVIDKPGATTVSKQQGIEIPLKVFEQSGYDLQKAIDAVKKEKPENPAFAAAASTVPLMDNPLKIRGTGDNGRINTIDVAKALNSFTKKQLPALKFDKAEPAEQVARAKSIAEDEARYQLAQNNTGETWYTKDMATHDKVLQDMRPELENPAKLSMFKMVEAVLSSGQKPYANFKSAVKAWDYYHEHGQFPPTNPDTNMSWGPRGPVAYSNAIDIINRLIKEKGEQGASDWLLGDHTVKELREYNNAKRGGGGGGVAGKQDDVLPGVMVLGPKRGPFAQNLHGQASAFTADMWVARSWNRWMGTTEIDPNGEEISSDRPRNAKERELIKQSFQETAQKLNLTTSALQAVLWYYEQGLYDVHGSPKESWSFSDAAKRAADEEFNSFKFGEE